MSLCKQSPFSLLFMVKRGIVNHNFVIGIKKGKLVKFSPNQLKFPTEVYGGYGRDHYYEGVSEAKDAYISLYRAYQEVASKYKTEPRISYEHIERDVVVSRIFSEIKNGSGKGIWHKPMFVFIDFDTNTIYPFCRYNKHYDCGFENRKFLQRFAAVYLEHNSGKLPSSFMSFAPPENRSAWEPPYIAPYTIPKSGSCEFSCCQFFRGYNPEKKTVRCGLAKHYKNYGTSQPTIVEISPAECYSSIKEKERNTPSLEIKEGGQ